jgi:hypothetical protein
MKQFLVLFREPDGRKETHAEKDVKQHREDVAAWMNKIIAAGALLGGKALTLTGSVIKDGNVTDGAYTKGGDEIVGGYLLIQAGDLTRATNIITGCPILNFGGFAEVRECMEV